MTTVGTYIEPGSGSLSPINLSEEEDIASLGPSTESTSKSTTSAPRMSKGNNEASAKRKRSPSKTERNVKRKVVEQEKEEPSEDLPEKIVKKNEEDEGYAVYYTPGGSPYLIYHSFVLEPTEIRAFRSLNSLMAVIEKGKNAKQKKLANGKKEDSENKPKPRRGRPPKKGGQGSSGKREKATKMKASRAQPEASSLKLAGVELRMSFEEEEKIAGKNWLQTRVECYWAYPASQRGFYPGIIKDVRRSDEDVEYLVEYVADPVNNFGPPPGPEWEVPDEGMRFSDPRHTPELERVIEIRKKRGTYVPVNILDRPKGKEKRARIGEEYQVDDGIYEKLKPKKGKVDVGVCMWRPDMISTPEINTFLQKTRSKVPVPNPLTRSMVSIAPHPSLITRETALTALHDCQYDVRKALEGPLKAKKWYEGPMTGVSTEWTIVETIKFEVAMKMDPKNFPLYRMKFPQKSLAQIIEFYWFWRSSARYENWLLAKSQIANFFQRALLEKQDQGRNPRLRKRLRIDYSEEKPWIKNDLADSDYLKILKYTSRPKSKKVRREIFVYDVQVYADLYFPEEDLKTCENYILRWKEEKETYDEGESESVSCVSESEESEESED